MVSDATRHTAAVLPGVTVEGGPTAWGVTWLPGRLLTRNQAVTAMTIAEVVAEHDAPGDPLRAGHRLWAHLESWAAELGIADPRTAIELVWAAPAAPAEGEVPGVW
jgi:hypothetical protein